MLEDDSEWRECLQEAAQTQSGSQLRSLFAVILLNCEPSTPLELWEIFRNQICDDLKHKIQHERHIPPEVNAVSPTEEHIWDFGLFLLERILSKAGKALTDFGLPTWTLQWVPPDTNPLILEQRDYDSAAQLQLAQSAIVTMNPDQLAAYNRVTNSVTNDLGEIFFLNGPGGTGKTFVYRAIANFIRGQEKIVLCVASSGIAALLLDGGTTAHSRFKIPLRIHEDSTCSIRHTSRDGELIEEAVACIWDEAPMQNRYCMEAVDRICRDLRKVDRPFGGLTVIFGGDFRQILPVVPQGSKGDILDVCLSRSPLWHHVETLSLRQNMRLQNGENPAFAQWLLDIGEGKLQENEADSIPLNQAYVIQGSIDELITTIYPRINQHQTAEYFKKHSILTTKNYDVDDINSRILSQYPGQEYNLSSADKMEENELDEVITGMGQHDAYQTPEFLQSIKPNGFPLAKLKLKVGIPVMILRNLDILSGLCNGTRVIITRITSRLLEGTIIGGNNEGTKVFIPRITFLTNENDFPFILRRRQFPVRLAFSMTINKSQGQTLWSVGIDLRTPVFSHGQLYVALSRITAPNRLKILLPPAEEPHDSAPKTKNVVWKEILLNE